MLEHTDAGGVDEDAVGFAFVDNLGVAGDQRDSGARGRLAHGFDDQAQGLDGQPFLENEAGAEIERTCAAHGQVVDGAVDGQIADVAAGETRGCTT